jgi:hypothetical protein
VVNLLINTSARDFEKQQASKYGTNEAVAEAEQRNAARGNTCGMRKRPISEILQAKLKVLSVGPPITEPQINSVIPDSFAGRREFIGFYLRHNGCFEDQVAYFYRDKLCHVSRGIIIQWGSKVSFLFFAMPVTAHEPSIVVRVRELLARCCPELNNFIETIFKLSESQATTAIGLRYRPVAVDIAHPFVKSLKTSCQNVTVPLLEEQIRSPEVTAVISGNELKRRSNEWQKCK